LPKSCDDDGDMSNLTARTRPIVLIGVGLLGNLLLPWLLARADRTASPKDCLDCHETVPKSSPSTAMRGAAS
jgi:hypothetical protein